MMPKFYGIARPTGNDVKATRPLKPLVDGDFGSTLEQPKDGSELVTATEAMTWLEFPLALQVGGRGFESRHVHQPYSFQ